MSALVINKILAYIFVQITSTRSSASSFIQEAQTLPRSSAQLLLLSKTVPKPQGGHAAYSLMLPVQHITIFRKFVIFMILHQHCGLL